MATEYSLADVLRFYQNQLAIRGGRNGADLES
jgi:hypothetical protein